MNLGTPRELILVARRGHRIAQFQDDLKLLIFPTTEITIHRGPRLGTIFYPVVCRIFDNKSTRVIILHGVVITIIPAEKCEGTVTT